MTSRLISLCALVTVVALTACANSAADRARDAASDAAYPLGASGRKALVEAVHQKQSKSVRLLLEAGADPNAVNQNREAVLIRAVHDKENEIVELLLDAGADPNAKNQNREPVLVRAVHDKQREIVALLLAHGADPNGRNQNRQPVLVEAVKNKDVEMVRLLVDYGARSDQPDQNGNTALSIAATKKRTELIELLLTPVVTAKRQPIERPTALQRQLPGDTPKQLEPISPSQSLYSKRVAVVIGINDYQHWPPLEGARSDARRVSQTLRGLGFDEVIEIYDAQATRRNLLTKLGQTLAELTDESSLAMIYFAGHGQTETLPGGQKRGYIIPVDGDRDQVYATAISMDQLRGLSSRLPARQVYYVMDSCYSGLGFVRGIALKPHGEGYLRKVTGMRSVQMITAGLQGEMAVESGGQGLFTTYFLRALSGEADFNGDGYVTASEIGTYVRPEVSSASKHRQTPQFGALEGQGEVALPVFARPRRTTQP